jgi:type II secretory pathway pseudopilin PulG
MGKRGIALIMSLLVILVLAILSSSFVYSVVNENRLANRFVNSTRAFWLAEAGIAEAKNNMPADTSGTLGASSHTYSTHTTQLLGEYYSIDSTGAVNLGPGQSISRSISAVVRTNPVDPNNFQHAIRTTTDLIIKGSADINGPTEEFASLNFADLFEHSNEELRSYATRLYTDPPVDIASVEGITWVDLSPGEEFRISSDTWRGGCGPDLDCSQAADNGAVLVVSGDAQITGGTFYGIIYVIGRLRMSGNPTINGTVLVESQAEINTTLTGNVTINYNSANIVSALSYISFMAPVIVSWQEI